MQWCCNLSFVNTYSQKQKRPEKHVVDWGWGLVNMVTHWWISWNQNSCHFFSVLLHGHCAECAYCTCCICCSLPAWYESQSWWKCVHDSVCFFPLPMACSQVMGWKSHCIVLSLHNSSYLFKSHVVILCHSKGPVQTDLVARIHAVNLKRKVKTIQPPGLVVGPLAEFFVTNLNARSLWKNFAHLCLNCTQEINWWSSQSASENWQTRDLIRSQSSPSIAVLMQFSPNLNDDEWKIPRMPNWIGVWAPAPPQVTCWICATCTKSSSTPWISLQHFTGWPKYQMGGLLLGTEFSRRSFHSCWRDPKARRSTSPTRPGQWSFCSSAGRHWWILGPFHSKKTPNNIAIY